MLAAASCRRESFLRGPLRLSAAVVCTTPARTRPCSAGSKSRANIFARSPVRNSRAVQRHHGCGCRAYHHGEDHHGKGLGKQSEDNKLAAARRLLGVAAAATPKDLKRAYEKEALRWHPDRREKFIIFNTKFII